MEWVFITEWFHTEKYLTIPFERNDPTTAKPKAFKSLLVQKHDSHSVNCAPKL